MNTIAETGLLAIDIGNSRVKFGWFPPSQACTSELQPSMLPIAAPVLPQPEEMQAFTHRGVSSHALIQDIEKWLETITWQGSCCIAASVCPEVEDTIQKVIGEQTRFLTCKDLSLKICVDRPEQVGIDRLMCAVAANRLRQSGQVAVSVSAGTAITVNFSSEEGAFEGGAILPGIDLSAASLHKGTANLPQVSTATLETPPDPVGKSTIDAIRTGIYWGAIGAIRQLAELQCQTNDPKPLVLVTGGDAKLLVEQLLVADTPARLVPHMVLAGIAIVAEELA